MYIQFKEINIESEEISRVIGDKKIMFLIDKLGHDGYDNYGPQSDLWDVYVFTKEQGDYVYYHFHTEYWYEQKSGPIPDYELYDKQNFSEITFGLEPYFEKNKHCANFMEIYEKYSQHKKKK